MIPMLAYNDFFLTLKSPESYFFKQFIVMLYAPGGAVQWYKNYFNEIYLFKSNILPQGRAAAVS